MFDINTNLAHGHDMAEQAGQLDMSILIDEPDGRPPSFQWSSQHLTSLTDVSLVIDRAAALKALLDGALLISHGSRGPKFHLGRLWNDEGTSFPVSPGNPLAEPFDVNLPMWDFTQNNIFNPFRHFVSKSIFLARHDRTTQGILCFLGVNGITWISLYAVQDFLKSAGYNSSHIAKEAGVELDELKRFGHTANNFKAIGPYARHGEQGWTPPANPMTLEEAEAIFLVAVKSLINRKASELEMHLKNA